MKSCSDYINKAIDIEINKVIKEAVDKNGDEITDQDTLDTLTTMDDFVKDEKKQSDTSIKTSLKLMGALSDPIKRSSENMNLKVQKDRAKKLDDMKKSVEDQQKALEDSIKQKQIQAQTQGQNTNVQTTAQSTTQISAITERVKNIIKTSLPMITRDFFVEQDSELPALPPAPAPQIDTPSKKAYIVKFDTKTQEPFQVKFSERGFSIDNTRLSFEALENALSKNYTIVLNNGSGLALNAIRMQKILKYKDKWY